ncbi:hypothetical protein [Paenibacillus mucilaginosus]|uniref:Uncharacterized protein n=3 Tax=Paenibacillus mucilaginosus TaxID=61624 RepID=H6NJX4_9BACL|nr:hypothetical protein [Paenibacillus mucilaginosus]AEI41773.1 hypothetical protein KNP414_03215 [Paenibacillus mucilaginosus KNP414]AFC30278.1 hypothetical protein PM3016_3439 [Paenibacillus mucilaginosus 3016]AFH62549.1 hypothetical protein B2K_17775 [Paenibacillus mucilaginosus K02]
MSKSKARPAAAAKKQNLQSNADVTERLLTQPVPTEEARHMNNN